MSKVPLGAFGFKVSIGSDNEKEGMFQEVSGLGIQINVTDMPEGGENSYSHKVLGNATYPDVTFKRGLINDNMFNWIKSCAGGAGQIERKNIMIEIMKDDYSTGKKYILKNAVPVKWDGPSLNVMSDAIATESLTVAIEGLELG